MTDMTVKKAIDIVWDYHQMHIDIPADIDTVIVLGSRDDRVAAFAAEFLRDRGVPNVLITGGSAHHGSRLAFPEWPQGSEAEHFESVMRSSGYHGDLILEKHATNTGENAGFAQAVLKDVGVVPRKMLIITKPYMERRALKTFEKQWQLGGPEMYVTSMGGSFDDYVSDSQPADVVTNVMVGDLERIIQYPDLGFMTASHVPTHVIAALRTLKSAGFTRHTIKK